MSTSSITSSLLTSLFSSSSTANHFATDLNQLAQDLQSGGLSAAQQDYVTLSEDALAKATNSTASSAASDVTTSMLSALASSSSLTSSFLSELTQLGSDLNSGSLTAAQSDMTQLETIAQSASSSATTTNNSGQAQLLIHSYIQALEAGDDSAAGTALSHLASISTSSQGASILSQLSDGYGSSSSSSVSQLLSSISSSSTNSYASLISAVA